MCSYAVAKVRPVLGHIDLFSSHPQVRRDARRRPMIALARFAMVALSAAIVGFAISQFS